MTTPFRLAAAQHSRRLLATLAVTTVLAAGPALAEEKVTFVTTWKAQAEHGGYYQALALGLFQKHGLDVKIRMGGPGINTSQLVASGAVDFAMGSNNDYALELAKVGAGVKAVMAGFQKMPQILMTHPGNGIEKLEDMKGKPILISSGSITTFWVWLKAKYGFEDSQIRKYTFNMAPFIANKDTIQQGYLSSEPFIVEQKSGIRPKVFLLANYGYSTYGSLTLVPEKWIKEKPKVVQAFVNASIEGWHSYLHGDPKPGNALIQKDNPEMTDETIAFGIKVMKESGIVESGDTAKFGIGAMTDARWKDHYDTAVAQGRYPKDLKLADAYTLDFVNKNYAPKM